MIRIRAWARGVAAVVALALAAAVAPAGATPASGTPAAAPATAAVEPAASELAGIEVAGPIATTRGSGPLVPRPQEAVAVVPGAPATSGETPWLLVKSLQDDTTQDTYRVRVYDASRGFGQKVTDLDFSYVWEGTLTKGWGRIAENLIAGNGYVVWAYDPQPQGGWVQVGRFSVRGSVDPAGPTTTAGGMSVELGTGELTWAWESPGLLAPAPGVAVGLRWQAGQSAQPGLPPGWQFAVNSGSPWRSIEEAGSQVKALVTPATPMAERLPGGRVEVTFDYPLAGREKPRRFVIDELVVREGSSRWRRVAETSLNFAQPGVERTVPLLPGARQVRVGVVSEGVVLYSPSAPIVKDPRPPLTTVQAANDECRSAVRADESPESVVLRGWNGMSQTFLRNDWGVYEQVYGGEDVPGYRSTLSLCSRVSGANSWLFTDSSGVVTRFEAGHAVSVVSRGQPVVRMTWQDGRLESVTNGIGRRISLTYAGQGSCPAGDWAGFAPSPSGQLCRITYPNGTSTEIGYVADGLRQSQIALVKDPGNTGTTLAWDSVGRIVASRSTLANRAATVDPAAASAVARVAYDDEGRVRTISEAPGTPGGPTISQQVVIPVINERILRAGDPVQASVRATGSGYSMSNTAWVRPETLQASRFQDAASLTVRSRTDDTITVSTDARGLETTVVYDEFGNVIRQSGPVDPGRNRTGSTVSASYDTVRTNGRDEALQGMAVTRFDGAGFTGNSHSDFWLPDGRAGLSARWSGLPSTMSAIASAVWTPTPEQDKAAEERGWNFSVKAPTDAQVRLIVEGNPCIDQCTLKELPPGPKHVTVEVARGGSTGWFSIKASTGGTPEALPGSQVVPGFNNRTRTESNDTYVGSSTEPATDFSFAQPETGQVTSVTTAGGLSSRMTYERVDPDAGQWGRLSTYTTPGGLTQTTDYWPNTGSVALPEPCTGTAVASGQARTITRQDGSKVTGYYDMSGHELASVTEGVGAERETVCSSYYADGMLRTSASYNASGALIEKVENELGIGGDPLTVRQKVTHGPAAPIDPGTTVSSTTTVDLRGKPVRYIDEAGTTTVTTYTASGDPETLAITLSGQTAPVLTFRYSYRQTDGALVGVTVNGVPAAAVEYGSGTGEVTSVTYAGGAARLAMGYDVNGRPDRATVSGGGARYASEITFTEFGRIQSSKLYYPSASGSSADLETRGYSYDEAGRLVKTVISSGPQSGSRARIDYGYAYARTQDSSCGGAYPAAASDALRTGGSRAGVSYVTCHDGRGRLASTTDPLVTGDSSGKARATVEHDALGRVVAVRGVARPLELQWSSGTQVARVAEGSPADLVATVLSTYGGRLVDKTVTTTQGAERVRYTYSGSASPSPVAILGMTGDEVTGVAELTYALPGGARVTVPAGGTPTVTISDLQGAAVATFAVPTLAVTGVSGSAPATDVGLASRFGSFGEALVTPPLTGSATPSYGWQLSNRHETLAGTSSISLLGARPYLPAVGEFLAPDPLVDAGTNLYSYTPADPINGVDRTGQANEWSWFWQIVNVVLVVAAIAVDIAAPFLAPATSAGMGAWFAFTAVSVGASFALTYAAGKAMEQSIRTQEEPSAALDNLRATVMWTQLIETVVMIGIPIVKFAARVGTKLVRYAKSVFRGSRGAADVPFEVGTGADASIRSLSSARSSVRFTMVIEEAPAFSNGARESISSSLGRLSTKTDGLTFKVEGNRESLRMMENFLP